VTLKTTTVVNVTITLRSQRELNVSSANKKKKEINNNMTKLSKEPIKMRADGQPIYMNQGTGHGNMGDKFTFIRCPECEFKYVKQENPKGCPSCNSK